MKKKLKITINPDGDIEIGDFDAQLTQQVGDAEIAAKRANNEVEDEKSFAVVLTNPCMYINILGAWYRICWP